MPTGKATRKAKRKAAPKKPAATMSDVLAKAGPAPEEQAETQTITTDDVGTVDGTLNDQPEVEQDIPEEFAKAIADAEEQPPEPPAPAPEAPIAEMRLCAICESVSTRKEVDPDIPCCSSCFYVIAGVVGKVPPLEELMALRGSRVGL